MLLILTNYMKRLMAYLTCKISENCKLRLISDRQGSVSSCHLRQTCFINKKIDCVLEERHTFIIAVNEPSFVIEPFYSHYFSVKAVRVLFSALQELLLRTHETITFKSNQVFDKSV